MNAGQRTTMMAGWLFVDLLLVLFLVQLGSSPVIPAPTAAGPAEQVTPPSSAPGTPPGLDPQSRSIDLAGDADGLLSGDGRAADDLRAQIATRGATFTGRRAAMVLVFGSYGGCPGCPPTNGPSTAYAQAAIPLFYGALPAIFPPDRDFYRNYLDTGMPAGSIHAEIFFFTG